MARKAASTAQGTPTTGAAKSRFGQLRGWLAAKLSYDEGLDENGKPKER
jgi:hypothetical protein